MSVRNDCILEGPPMSPVPNCSLAEYLLPKMRSLPKKFIIQVDAEKGTAYSMEEFLDTSIRLSEGLKKIGLRENDVVGLLSRNCFEANAVVLATWLSGAVIAPMADGTVDEMKHIFEMVRPKIFICKEEAVSIVASTAKLLSMSVTIILVDTTTKNSSHPYLTVQDVLDDAETENYKPQPVSSPGTQLVAILFSSGTSGLPKGVQLTHTNFIFQDLNMETVLPAEDINCLQISNFFWVTGVLMFLRSLSAGTTRVLLGETTPAHILRAIDRYKTTWTLIGPSLALSVVESPEFESFDLSSMKKLYLGGSPVTSVMIEKIKAKWPTAEIIVVYGTTEVSGTISKIQAGDDLTSVGRVTKGVKVKIADVNTGQALKANRKGEICVKSLGIMRGYMGNEEATREAVDSEGWCHTGDLGYYDESGLIFLEDRIKEMIKIMNMQVAPAELENVILGLPGVSEVAVAGVTPDGNRCQIMALVVKSKNSTITEEDIKAKIANTLSDYKKLTGGVRFVESLPKTNSGKLSRKAIKNIAQALYSGSSG